MRSGGAFVVVAISVLMLVAVSSIVTAHDLIDDILLPSQGYNSKGAKGKPWDCCDNCMCTRLEPPLCRCRDIVTDECHPNCKTCICTMSIPAQCRCVDVIKELCGPRCTPES